MGNGDKTILVTGATGRQGGAAIRHLLPNGWKLRALTRHPNGYAAKQLSGQGVEVVRGELEDPESLERAAHGVYGIFSVQDYWVAGSGAKSNKARTWLISPRKQALPILSTAPLAGPWSGLSDGPVPASLWTIEAERWTADSCLKVAL